MATPLGHGLAGYWAYLLIDRHRLADHRGLVSRCVIAAILPDLDVLPGLILGSPALFHQGLSHSVLFAGGAGLLLATLPGCRDVPWRRRWGIFTLAYLSHLALDLVGPDHRPPYGVPLFWPLSNATFLAPVTLLPGVRHAGRTLTDTGEWIGRALDPRNLVALLVEAAIFLPLVIAWRILRRRKRSS